jgi:hypothetical protein
MLCYAMLCYIHCYSIARYRSSQHPQNSVTHQIDHESKKELHELQQCILYRYMGIFSSVVLLAVPIYFIRRRVYSHRQHAYKSINLNTTRYKTATLLLCSSIMLYGVIGRLPSDQCYDDYMIYCDSDVARRSRILYNNTIDAFKDRYHIDTVGHHKNQRLPHQYSQLDPDVVDLTRYKDDETIEF